MTIQKFEVPDWIRSVLICDPTDIWGNVVGMGLAELAAVLSPSKRFDRRGSIIFLDDFEHGLGGWLTAYVGTGAAVEVSSTWPFEKGLSVKLTTGKVADQYAYIIHDLAYLVESKVGVKFSFTISSVSQYMNVISTQFTGTKGYQGRVQLNPSAGTLDYQDVNGDFTNFATGVKVRTEENGYNHHKLVIDLVTKYYVRYLLNNVEYDLSAYRLYEYDSDTAPTMRVDAWLFTNVANNVSSYVDAFEITQNEPA